MLVVLLLLVRVEALEALDSRAVLARARMVDFMAAHVNLRGGLVLMYRRRVVQKLVTHLSQVLKNYADLLG